MIHPQIQWQRDDANFLAAFRHSATVKTGKFPPAALVELYHEPEAIAARLRRLHLVIVGLCHPRKTATRTEKQFYQQITRLRDARGVSITPIPLCNQEEWRCGYSLDDSDKPVFLIWPERSGNNGFWLLDVARNQYHNLCQATSIRNLGLEHFYAAFGLGCFGTFGLPQPVPSALVRITSVKIVLSHVELPTVCDHCPMAPPAKLTSRKKPKLTRRKQRYNLRRTQ